MSGQNVIQWAINMSGLSEQPTIGLASLPAFPADSEKTLVIAQYAAAKHAMWTGCRWDMVQ